jgi:hypothetical protein
VSPREDPAALFAEAETHLLAATSMLAATEDSETLREAKAVIDTAWRDLEWNVYPTDTTAVVERMVEFTERLRDFLGDVPATSGTGSDFRSDSALEAAHGALAVLRRHLELVRHYDTTAKARHARLTTEVDQELEIIAERGAQAKEALVQLLNVARRSLERLG